MPTGREVHEQVGAEVRARRVANDLTIAELARRAEVSAAFISQLEAGRTSISIPTLFRVATALGCTPNCLLAPDGSRPHLVRAGEGLRLRAGEGRHAVEPRVLSRAGPAVILQAQHYVIHPGDDEQEWFQHEGEDFVYVVRGAIELCFGDGTSAHLEAGDSLHYEGTTTHQLVLAGEDPAELLIVVGSGAGGFTPS